MFFSQKVDAIIVDKNVFNWHKLYFKNNEEYTFHKIFNTYKEYPVTFRSQKVRDDFNIGLNILKKNGRYDEILKFYETQNVNELVTLTKLLSDISSKYVFEQDKQGLIDLFKIMLTHPDIEGISIKIKNENFLNLDLHKQVSGNKKLQEITSKIYYKTESDLLYLGELSLHYKQDYKTKNGKAIASLDSLKILNSKDYDYIKN